MKAAIQETAKLLKGDFYKESNSQRVLCQLLQKAGYVVSTEVLCPYYFGDIYAGYGRMDVVCSRDNERFILELKVGFVKEDLCRAQLRKYVKHMKMPGFLVIFQNNSAPIIKECKQNIGL